MDGFYKETLRIMNSSGPFSRDLIGYLSAGFSLRCIRHNRAARDCVGIYGLHMGVSIYRGLAHYTFIIRNPQNSISNYLGPYSMQFRV